MTNPQFYGIILTEREVNEMKYYLIDDPLCDLDPSLDCYEDCTECPLFEECMEIKESEE